MKTKHLLISVFIFLGTSTLFAGTWMDTEKSLPKELQNHNRVYVAYTASQFHLLESAQAMTILKPINGLTVGYSRYSNLTTHNTYPNAKELPLFLEWGASITWQHSADYRDLFDPNGNHTTIDGYKFQLNYLNVAIPLNVAYVFHVGDFFIKPFLGPNIKINVFAQQKTITPTETINTNLFKDVKDTMKHFQFGYNAGVDFGYKFISLGYKYQGECMPLMTTSSHKVLQGTHMVVLGFNF